jgi:hypothetical protein
VPAYNTCATTGEGLMNAGLFAALPSVLTVQTANGTQLNPAVIPGGADSDGTRLGACVANFVNGYQPGKARFWGGVLHCNIGWGGREYSLSTLSATGDSTIEPNAFKVVFDPKSDAGWVPSGQAGGQSLLADGYDNNNTADQLFACRAHTPYGLIPGKWAFGWTACDFGYGGAEMNNATYELYVP